MTGLLKRIRALNPSHGLERIFTYEVIRHALWFLVWLFYGLRFYGGRHAPKKGGCLIIANHQSNLDPSIMGSICWRHLHFVARDGLFTSPTFGWLIRQLNAIPIDQSKGDTAAIKTVIQRLREGHLVLIFPEGSRTKTGAIEEFKPGAALLLKRAGVPVLPMAIEGSFDAWPSGQALPNVRGRIQVMVGPPISAEEIKRIGTRETLETLREQIDEMRLKLRGRIRCASRGRFPKPGPGDYDIHHQPPSNDEPETDT